MSILQEVKHYTRRYHSTSEPTEFQPTQMGAYIKAVETDLDLEHADLLLIGCGEFRGQLADSSYSNGPDKIREALYALHCWHPEIKIGELGNVITGENLADTKAALKTVLSELHPLRKKVLVLGGSHDLTLQQYEVFRENRSIIDFTVIDMLADLGEGKGTSYDDHLMTALTAAPNYVRHFNLIGFQSYYVNPNLIETLDKLRFDCLRVGKAREDIEQIEPSLRGTHLLSIDMNAVRYSDAPSNLNGSPNGFFGDEMCKITRYAGMSQSLCSMGIYGYLPEHDSNGITARLIAQMIWYYIDGLHVAQFEASLNDRDQFLEYQLTFTDQNSLFLKSKRSNRWWMQLPEGRFIACSHQDYITACHNELPERWLREMERLVD